MIKYRPEILLILITALFWGMDLSANPKTPPADPDLNHQNNEPAPASNMNLRIYRLFDQLGSDYAFPENAYVMDVVATIEECNDGSRNITAMNIGGWTYDLDSSCADKEYRGIITIEKGKALKPAGDDASAWNVTVLPSNQQRPARSTIICDAGNWSCSTTPAPGQKREAGTP